MWICFHNCIFKSQILLLVISRKLKEKHSEKKLPIKHMYSIVFDNWLVTHLQLLFSSRKRETPVCAASMSMCNDTSVWEVSNLIRLLSFFNNNNSIVNKQSKVIYLLLLELFYVAPALLSLLGSCDGKHKEKYLCILHLASNVLP